VLKGQEQMLVMFLLTREQNDAASNFSGDKAWNEAAL
jgi:hypothetical protein